MKICASNELKLINVLRWTKRVQRNLPYTNAVNNVLSSAISGNTVDFQHMLRFWTKEYEDAKYMYNVSKDPADEYDYQYDMFGLGICCLALKCVADIDNAAYDAHFKQLVEEVRVFEELLKGYDNGN